MSQRGLFNKTNHVLSQRAQEKIDKYRAGYAAQDVRKAFLPAVVSTSGRIHGDLLRLLYLLADNKTKRHYRDRHEVIDDDSEAYCWRTAERLLLAHAGIPRLGLRSGDYPGLAGFWPRQSAVPSQAHTCLSLST